MGLPSTGLADQRHLYISKDNAVRNSISLVRKSQIDILIEIISKNYRKYPEMHLYSRESSGSRGNFAPKRSFCCRDAAHQNEVPPSDPPHQSYFLRTNQILNFLLR